MLLSGIIVPFYDFSCIIFENLIDEILPFCQFGHWQITIFCALCSDCKWDEQGQYQLKTRSRSSLCLAVLNSCCACGLQIVKHRGTTKVFLGYIHTACRPCRFVSTQICKHRYFVKLFRFARSKSDMAIPKRKPLSRLAS